jgi:hypothetical protein
MPTDLDSERWRALGVEAFATAQTITDPDSKHVILMIAAAYERLAKRAQVLRDQEC